MNKNIKSFTRNETNIIDLVFIETDLKDIPLDSQEQCEMSALDERSKEAELKSDIPLGKQVL